MPINTEFAQNLVKAGMGMVMEEMHHGDKLDIIQNRISLGARLSSDIIPAVKSGQLKGKDIPKAINEAGGEFGVDPLDSMEIYNNIFKLADDTGLDLNEILDIKRKTQAIEKGELALQEARKEPAQKAIEKISAEEVGATVGGLKKIWNISRKAESLEDLIDTFADTYADVGLEGFLGRNIPKNKDELAEMLADYFYSNDIEGFRSYKKDSIRQAMRKLVSQPKRFTPDDVFKSLLRPKPLGGGAENEALDRLIQNIGG